MKDQIDLHENPAYQLWLATNAWQRQVRRALLPLGLTHVQFTILAAVRRLGAAEEVVSQADVCRFGSLDPNMASEVFRYLERKGLVTRLPHPTDGRAHELALTSAGEELLDQAKALVVPVSKAFFAPLGEEQKELARMLRTIARQDIADVCQGD
ncbi:MarR family winged helix-turn-helix transcriptional regulator [Fimbriimonas ginsengisoli]|nr:MarR family transcriptional regulator [Fimbriimonas ginsengisoli]